jgi:hypothetical protein
MPETLPFRLRESFLSPAEVDFYHVLRSVVHDQLVAELLTIAPKVSVLDMVSVIRPNENVHQFSRLLRQSVDFLLIHRPTLNPRLAIELEYPKQTRHRTDRFLDELFGAVELPFLRVTVEKTYSGDVLARMIQRALPPSGPSPQRLIDHYSPICPDCGITMVLRFYRAGTRAGKRYYGCLNFPKCRQIVAVD